MEFFRKIFGSAKEPGEGFSDLKEMINNLKLLLDLNIIDYSSNIKELK